VTQIIEIENGLVKLVEKSTQYSIPLADWVSKIEKRSPIRTPVLPTGTRAVHWDPTDLNNQSLVVLIEREPHIMRMDYGGEVRRLSVPWTRFFFYCSTTDPTNRLSWNLADYRVYWSKSRYSDPAERDMIAALLPNVYEDGRICFGSTGANADQSLADRLDQTVNDFFVSRFNDDLHIRRPNRARTYRQWMRMTENNPTGWTEWEDWDPNNGYHTFVAFDDLVARRTVISDRFSPMIARDPIPEVPLGATFGRLQEWLDGLDQSQRSRLMTAMLTDRALHNERYEDVVEVEEDEDE
jgi:hypothetical protein